MNLHRVRRTTAIVAAGLVAFCACGGSSSSVRKTPSTPSPSTGAVSTVSLPATESLHLLVLGDSIVIPERGCGSCKGFDEQYAAYLEKATGRRVVLSNQARPDAAILDLQSVLDSDDVVRAEVAQADVVVVSIGYNSGPPFAPDEPCHAPEAVHDIDQLKAILAFTPDCVQATLEIRSQQLDAVYKTMERLAGDRSQLRVTFGVFNNFKGNPGSDGTFADLPAADMAKVQAILASLTDDWNAMNCGIATGYGFVCADLYHAFNGAGGNESLKRFVGSDFTHPSEAGQAVMARLLEKVPLDPIQ